MSDRWVVLGAVGAIAVTAVVAVARAEPRTERFALDPNGGRVLATASLDGAALTISVAGLPEHARVAASIHRLACAQHGYGGVPAGGAVADAAGHAGWTADGAVGAAARDGRHVLVLGAAGRTVACAGIPAHEPAHAAPRGHWGIWSFAHRFVD